MTAERGRRTLVAWCPDWPLVAAGILPHVPAAVFHANRVVACTAAARAEGVTRGLRRREAQARCSELVVEPQDPGRETRAFEPIVAAVEAFTPGVEVTRPGACALPTRGPSRYFGGDEKLAAKVQTAVDTALSGLVGGVVPEEVRSRIGIADGPFSAALAARQSLVVDPGSSPEFLAPLPVSLLDEPELSELLTRLGLRTLGAFAALDPGDVIGRFGPVGVAAHRRARGLDDRSLTTRVPPPDLTTEMELDPPADRVDTAAFAAKVLADRLCSGLAAAGLICPCIRIEAETEHGESLARVWRHHRAFAPATVAERVRWQLDGWLAERTRTTGGLTLLRLVPEEVDVDDGRQSGFWGGMTEADDRAARGFARVQGLLGPDAVFTAVLRGGRGPADQVRLVRWGDPRVRNPSPTEEPSWPGRVPAPTPALVPVRALEAELVDAQDQSVGVTSRSFVTRSPHRLSIEGGRWSRIRAWAGPWTADEKWWDPVAHRRLARLQVVTADGKAFLLVFEGGRWGVEGVYD